MIHLQKASKNVTFPLTIWYLVMLWIIFSLQREKKISLQGINTICKDLSQV